MNNLDYSETVTLAPSNSGSPISALNFDNFQELLHCGNEQGRVTSLINQPASFHKYISFPGFPSPVNQLLSNDNGLFIVGENTVRHTLRRGVPSWRLSPDFTNSINCMSFTNTSSEILLAGHPNKLFLANLYRGTVIREVESQGEIVIMKKSRMLCCGSSTGLVHLRDPRTLRIESTINAHTGTISDIDVAGNYLVTCGYSQRGSNLIIDPLIKLYDLRTMKSLAPVPFQSGPSFLKFHPKLSSTLFACSQLGNLQMTDIGNTSVYDKFYQINTNSYITTFETSSTGESIAFGTGIGTIHLWSNNPTPQFNTYSRLTEFADPAIDYSAIQITPETPLNTIGLPYYRTKLLSVWPADKKFTVGKPATKIPDSVLKEVKTLDFVGYAKNPRTFYRNQVMDTNQRSIENPKFRSEQQREELARFRSKSRCSDIDDTGSGSAMGSPILNRAKSGSFPSFYRMVEIKYSKFGVEDFDFAFYNTTPHSGLETHIKNCYCNSMLQVMFFIPALQKILLNHIGQTCLKEFCLSCELGFLFRMLSGCKGRNCQASNFLRAFGNVSQASALGLFEPDQPTSPISYAALIQNFSRFIFEQVHLEVSAILPVNTRIIKPRNDETSDRLQSNSMPSIVQASLGLYIESISECICSYQSVRDSFPFVLDLQYTKKTIPSGVEKKFPNSPSRSTTTSASFPTLLSESITKQNFTKAWCEKCTKYQPSTQYKHLQTLPLHLNINAGTGVDDSWWGFWKHKGFLSMVFMLLLKDGEHEIIEMKNKKGTNEVLDGRDMEGVEWGVYELKACIVEVKHDNEPAHLVSFVKAPEQKDGEKQWIGFNDFLVENIPESEVMHFRKWKIPAFLHYARVDVDDILDFESLPEPEGFSKIFNNRLLNLQRTLEINYTPLPNPSPLHPGFICAIDTEFIALSEEETEIRSDGSKSVVRPVQLSLARVSVLREEGCVPFIDDWISTTDTIVDYLTEFSGIKAGDLDPATSTHPLVPLKAAYKKLRHLIDMGCIFVGHGLKKDFRIINIHVPEDQVIDTVDIFFVKKRQRKLSLRYLAYVLLGQDIQVDTHDSIEDARTALLLYKNYLMLKEEGIFESTLDKIYEEGRSVNYKAPSQLAASIQQYSSPSSPPPPQQQRYGSPSRFF